MIQIPIFYATTEGQTARIAEQLAVLFRESGFSSAAIDVTSPRAAAFDWTPVKAVLIGASLHIGKHQKAAARFVRSHVHRLNEHPSAFFSVSLAAASKNPEEVQRARQLARDFCLAVGWMPDRVVAIAGRLAYSKYGWLTKWIMRRIARKEGAPTDASRDYEMTDWAVVSALASDIVKQTEARLAS